MPACPPAEYNCESWRDIVDLSTQHTFRSSSLPSGWPLRQQRSVSLSSHPLKAYCTRHNRLVSQLCWSILICCNFAFAQIICDHMMHELPEHKEAKRLRLFTKLYTEGLLCVTTIAPFVACSLRWLASSPSHAIHCGLCLMPTQPPLHFLHLTYNNIHPDRETERQRERAVLGARNTSLSPSPLVQSSSSSSSSSSPSSCCLSISSVMTQCWPFCGAPLTPATTRPSRP